MADIPPVIPGERIVVHSDIQAVVCSVDEESCIEVVYLDERKQAIGEEVTWTGEAWEFAVDGPVSVYAAHNRRLQQYVDILQSEWMT